MKFTLLLASLLISQFSFAQSMNEKRLKKEMLERTELLIEKVAGTREDLVKEDVVSACKKIKEIFAIYPDHLNGIGSRLNLDRGRTTRAKDEALRQLIFIHKRSLLCDQGKDSEFVDPEKLRKELKATLSSLESQRKLIRKSDADNENGFYYEYEF